MTEQEKLGPTAPALAEALGPFEPVMKLDFSACGVAGFNDALEKTGSSRLVITGIESHICVTQTVLQLVPRYDVHVVSDAASSRARENWRVAMDRMRAAGAVITSTEMVMYELLVRAGTPEFKETLPLVK